MIPVNGVTRMPIEAQQREIGFIARKIEELETRLVVLKEIHEQRLEWLKEAKGRF